MGGASNTRGIDDSCVRNFSLRTLREKTAVGTRMETGGGGTLVDWLFKETAYEDIWIRLAEDKNYRFVTMVY
jgi:hypothetical protein